MVTAMAGKRPVAPRKSPNRRKIRRAWKKTTSSRWGNVHTSIWDRLISYLPGVRQAFARAEEAEQKLAECNERRAALQAENLALQTFQQEMWQRFDSALERADVAQQVMINVEYQARHGFAPYPSRPKAPDSIEHAMKAMESPFAQARDLAREAEAKAHDELRAHLRGIPQ